MAERILYHGTTEDIGNSNADIFGKVNYESPDISGNLTDDPNYAWDKAIVRARKLGKNPCVITFSLPEEIIVDHGPIALEGTGLHGFSTNLHANPKEIPDDFLDRAYLPSRDLLEENRAGYVYRVPRKFAIKVENE